MLLKDEVSLTTGAAPVLNSRYEVLCCFRPGGGGGGGGFLLLILFMYLLLFISLPFVCMCNQMVTSEIRK